MIATPDRDEFLASMVIKLLKRNAIPNLKNIIAKTHTADLARIVLHLRQEEKVHFFNLLIEARLMGPVLSELSGEDRRYFLLEVVDQEKMMEIFAHCLQTT